ncbi:hypothetical protein QQ008_09605 [Fulvivirgaceae bacterium BMA10]|uniref:Uncharacterized protein n=1 Tax=Splendidivirga corallicola TaxID=3051826 RepID=A0ABT8KPJ6_9BACT|nr:hypothetical protein [Fulvivirgaceae bacterium BMA10]
MLKSVNLRALGLILIFMLPMFGIALADPILGEIDNEGTKTEETTKDEQKQAKKPDSLLNKQALQSPEKKVNKKKVENKPKSSSTSTPSYNFILYMIYKFKFSDIFNFSGSEKNSSGKYSEDLLLNSGRKIVSWLRSIEF